MSQPIRRAAMAIVLREEAERGWTARAVGSASEEKRLGCDILSAPPTGGDEHPVEVKGWGEPFLTVRGVFRYPQDIRASQYEVAVRDDRFRLEIVANLTALLAGTGGYQRLTLTAERIKATAVPRLYDVPLADLVDQIALLPRTELPDERL